MPKRAVTRAVGRRHGIACVAFGIPGMVDLEALRAQLERERVDMVKRTETPVIGIMRGDEADLATMALNKEHVLWLVKDGKERVAQIDGALARMDRGTYGACVKCGRLIPEERLVAMPLTLYCINCQTSLERQVRR